MARLQAAYAGLLDLCAFAAGVVFALIAALVSFDIAIRNLGIGNLPWLLEVAEYGLYVATFIAAPWVLREGAHVRVDLLLTVAGPRAAAALEVAIDAIGLVISLMLFWYGVVASLDAFRLGSMIFKELVVAEWWLLVIIPVSTSLLAVEFGLRLRRDLAGGA